MQKTALLGLGILGGILVLAAQRAAAAQAQELGGEAPQPWTPYVPEITPAAGDEGAWARVSAFLGLVRSFEANGDYSVLYGGGHFADFSTHPNVRVPFHNPATGRDDVSTAAGAYQINYPTFLEISRSTGLTDFSPETQDEMALWLLKKTGAYNALVAGDVEQALRLASSRWASLPGSTARQNPKSLEAALATYNELLNA